MKNNSDRLENEQYVAREIDKLVIHTVAWEGSDYDIEDIDRFHREEHGWRMVGYHYVILKDGTIQKGRPDDMIGAHVRGHNSHSIGISMQGHGDKEEWTQEQWDSVIRLCLEKMEEFDIPVESVYPHNHFTDMKTCPGTLVDFPEVRRRISQADIEKIDPVETLPPLEIPTEDEIAKEIENADIHA